MILRLAFFSVLTLTPLASFAASFDCAKASTADEKAICADPDLSKLDEQLARAYAQALKKGPKEAVQADQKAWLKERRDCGISGMARACLQGLYNRRIAELEGLGTRWSLADWQRASGTWSEAESTETNNQRLEIKAAAEKGVTFSLNSASGTHGGEIEGVAHFTADGAFFKDNNPDNESGSDELACQLRFVPLGPERLKVAVVDVPNAERPSCADYGGGVDFGGLFLKGIHQKELSLMDLGVFKSPAQDQAFRALVGDAYHDFAIRNPSPDADTKDIDGLGAEVATGWMRGMAPYGAIIMHTPGGHFYAAYMGWDEQKGTQLHYFSNDPRYAKQWPKTIEAWQGGSGAN